MTTQNNSDLGVQNKNPSKLQDPFFEDHNTSSYCDVLPVNTSNN
jgi:hypothetical protein